MFLESSRYFKQKTVDFITKTGRQVKAITLRRIPEVSGDSTIVKGNDRLDVIAHRQYDDATRFWHIADANTELQAADLVKEAGRVINIPEQ